MKYGLIGEHLGHSFSKDIHNLIGNYDYELKEIPPCDIDSFMKSRDFLGINVTIPYKQTVIPYLDEIDQAAKLIGAVNTVVNKNGKLYGYNTDFYGMNSLLTKMNLSVKEKNVLILGTGGTSKTACALVKSLGCQSVEKVSRHPEEEKTGEGAENFVQIISYEEAAKRSETNIIINTTPCGMFPKTDFQPISLDYFPKLEGLVDAIYNPNCTNLVLDAKKRGLKAEGGLYMLVGQAIKAAEFFFDQKIEEEKADKIFNTILGRKENIVLVGMPSCGKTSVGKQIAKLLNREFIDCDEEIVKQEGREISEIFQKEGEPYFRNIESLVIDRLSGKNSCVISTGGGAILNEKNVHNLKKNGKLYFINRPLSQLLPTDDRPTANSAQKIKALYDLRLPIYKACADMEVEGGRGIEKIAKEIIKSAGLECDLNQDVAIIEPGLAKGQVKVPPSKSLAHRSLICAALCSGQSLIKNVDFSQDILATLDCIRSLGAKVETDGNNVKITGCGSQIESKKFSYLIFNCRESGSTLRFFIPIGIQFAEKSEFRGSKVLMTRPQSIYEDLCKKNKIEFVRAEDKIIINAGGKKFESGSYQIPGNISSQFITGLLFVLPLQESDSQINLIPPVESRPYIDLTLQAMADFGVKVEWEGENTLKIMGGQKYKEREITVEGDYSNAAFLDFFNTVKGNVEIQGLNEKSLQGDRVYKKMFSQLVEGCPLLDISDCPDLGPILFVVAACHNGGTFTGTKRLAIKESDRGKIMCQELSKFGVKSEFYDNKIIIKKGILVSPNETLHGHNDHRIVMALASLLTLTGGKVDDAHAVSKSFPDYFEVIKSLGIKIVKK